MLAVVINPLTAGAAYIQGVFLLAHFKYVDINQQDLKRVDLHFVKSE